VATPSNTILVMRKERLQMAIIRSTNRLYNSDMSSVAFPSSFSKMRPALEVRWQCLESELRVTSAGKVKKSINDRLVIVIEASQMYGSCIV
jgi:hypothetical protein